MLRLGLHSLSNHVDFDQCGEGRAFDICGIEDHHRPVAGPAVQRDFTSNACLVAAVDMGPLDVNRFAALRGKRPSFLASESRPRRPVSIRGCACRA